MVTEIPSMWKLNIQTPQEPTPLSVLRKQAEELGEITGGTVLGRVESVASRDAITHHFSLYAPLIGYSHPLFSVTHHGIRLYPVKITSRSVLDYFGGEIPDYQSFLLKLGEVLNSQGVKEAIDALVAQSTYSSRSVIRAQFTSDVESQSAGE